MRNPMVKIDPRFDDGEGWRWTDRVDSPTLRETLRSAAQGNMELNLWRSHSVRSTRSPVTGLRRGDKYANLGLFYGETG